MMTLNTSTKTVTIFEGCNGSGKTTAAKLYAEKHNAMYIHFNALLDLHDLNEVYLAALEPALEDACNVVLDRSWMSEYPYSNVFRDGELRFDNRADLESIAKARLALVVYCKPDLEQLIKFYFTERNRARMVTSENDLRRLYELYDNELVTRNTLPFFYYDRFKFPDFISFIRNFEHMRNQIKGGPHGT